MDLLYGHNEAVAAWVAAHIPGCDNGFTNPTAIGVIEDERLIGGTVFTNYVREAGIIEMSSAGTDPRWLSPRMLRAIFSYPFDQLGCQLVVMRVAENNKRMVRIAQKFGFTGHLIPRLCGRDEGQWVFTLTDDAWRQHRFARSHHGL
jgi:RimJ/RimL family protein N-acetyltransferase